MAAHIAAHNPNDNAKISSAEARLLRRGASRSVDLSDDEIDLGTKPASIGSPSQGLAPRGSATDFRRAAGQSGSSCPCRVKRLSEIASSCLRFEGGRKFARADHFRRLGSATCNKKKSMFVYELLSLSGYLGVSANLE